MKYKYFTLLLCITFTTSLGFLHAQNRIASLQEPLVVLLDDHNGSIFNPSFIDLTPLSQGTPKALIQVGEELWIADQIEDRIDRFDLSGTYLSTISGGLDNIKGMAVVNETEVWVTNAGSNNGAPGDAIVRFDLSGNNLGFFATSGTDSAFDIIDVGGEVYISYISTESKIERRDYNGNVLGNIVEEGVVQFIQQIEYNPLNDSVYAAVFSTTGTNSSGLYEFAVSDGSILNYWDVGNLRGVAALSNSNILVSSSAGVTILDPDTNDTTVISTESGQYFGRIDLSPCTTPPTPTGDANQSFNEGATLADIVITPIDVTWFATETDAMNNENPLANSTVLVNGTTYYAVNVVDDCLSEPFAVTVTILLNTEGFDSNVLTVYPNPTHGALYLNSNLPLDRLTVYNIYGQRVMELNELKDIESIDFSQHAVGIYLLKAEHEEGSATIRVIKN
ncbi:MAG: T9SS type A sorting domain-containing protein [Flavobacteriaceae bacterium]|nr:T9SS type A sorting domain-containing protein [Flavobacteriaceae bacterium]